MSLGVVASHAVLGGNAAAYAAAVLADSPWGFWDTLEASGSFADSSGNNRTATLLGGNPTYAQPGPSGDADAVLWPDSSGATEYYAKTAAQLGLTAIKTLECWVKLNAVPTNPTPLVSAAYGYGNNSGRPMEMLVNTAGKVCLLSGTSSGATPTLLTAPTALTLGLWYHCVGVFSSGVMRKLRIDKTTVASDAPTISFTGSAFFFMHGGGTTAAANLTNGSEVLISKPAIYDALALSDARADAHYDAMMA